jgi:hypothetical protein
MRFLNHTHHYKVYAKAQSNSGLLCRLKELRMRGEVSLSGRIASGSSAYGIRLAA